MKSTLTNEQLIAKAKQWIKDLCESGGHKWCLRVPADHNHDPDLIFSELCNRLEEYAHQSGPRWVRASERTSAPDAFVLIRLNGEYYKAKYVTGLDCYWGDDIPDEYCEKGIVEWLSESSRVVSSGEGMAEALNLAQAEIRAMYKRLGISGSNVLDLIDKALASLSPAP